jgi:hypothetical protein
LIWTFYQKKERRFLLSVLIFTFIAGLILLKVWLFPKKISFMRWSTSYW